MLLLILFISMLSLIMIKSLLERNYIAIFIGLLMGFIILLTDAYKVKDDFLRNDVTEYIQLYGLLFLLPLMIVLIFLLALIIEYSLKSINKNKADFNTEYLITHREKHYLETIQNEKEKNRYFLKGLNEDVYLDTLKENEGWDDYVLMGTKEINNIIVDSVKLNKFDGEKPLELVCYVLKFNHQVLITYDLKN